MTRRDAGQAAVELAIALPLVVMVLLGAVQVALVARDDVATVHAAREGARAAAVAAAGGAVEAGRAAAQRATGLDPARLQVDVVERAGRVRVEVRYRAPTDVPLIGGLLGDVSVGASAVMAVEP